MSASEHPPLIQPQRLVRILRALLYFIPFGAILGALTLARFTFPYLGPAATFTICAVLVLLVTITAGVSHCLLEWTQAQGNHRPPTSHIMRETVFFIFTQVFIVPGIFAGLALITSIFI